MNEKRTALLTVCLLGAFLLTGGGEVGGIEEHETHRQQGEHIQVL